MRIDRHTTVTEVRPGETGKNARPSVVLSTGEVLEADLVIGADGSNSIVRNVVYTEENVSRPSEFALYVGEAPIAPMAADSELKPLIESEQVSLFLSLMLWDIRLMDSIYST